MPHDIEIVNRLAQWQPDDEIFMCLNCGVKFGFLTRRHHCRCCGGIFCKDCSDNFCQYDTRDQKVRVVTREEGDIEDPPYRTCTSCYTYLKSEKLLIDESSDSDDSINSNSVRSNTGIDGTTSADERALERIIEGSTSHDLRQENSSISSNNERTSKDSKSKHKDKSKKSKPKKTKTNHYNIRQKAKDTLQKDSNYCPICNLELAQFCDNAKADAHVESCIQTAETVQKRKSGGKTKEQSVYDAILKRILIYKVSASSCDHSSELNDSGLDPNECPICFEYMEVGDKVGRLECFCVFHYDCIQQWVKKKSQKISSSKDENVIRKNLCPLHDAIF